MKIIECPRDAMQGIHEFIPTESKIRYINSLLKVGFDTIDFGSFVSPTAIPQMRDTVQVLEKLELHEGSSKLLAIVANLKGVEQACLYPQITYLGFPLSVSETFQQRNTNKSIAQSFELLHQTQKLCLQHGKTLVVYISMSFGNPYGEAFDENIVAEFVEKLKQIDVKIVSLSDTIGVAQIDLIEKLYKTVIPAFPTIEFGSHFHSNPATSLEKIEAAYRGGCRRFDGAIKGLGGCPMAKDDLTGNIATEVIFEFAHQNKISLGLNESAFAHSLQLADVTFPM
jgi:hydroxymethylglutaryl-CoA lyase